MKVVPFTTSPSRRAWAGFLNIIVTVAISLGLVFLEEVQAAEASRMHSVAELSRSDREAAGDEISRNMTTVATRSGIATRMFSDLRSDPRFTGRKFVNCHALRRFSAVSP